MYASGVTKEEGITSFPGRSIWKRQTGVGMLCIIYEMWNVSGSW